MCILTPLRTALEAAINGFVTILGSATAGGGKIQHVANNVGRFANQVSLCCSFPFTKTAPTLPVLPLTATATATAAAGGIVGLPVTLESE